MPKRKTAMSKDRAAYSITDFCEAHSISRTTFYLLQKEGKAPRVMSVGNRRLISQEAAADWRRECEAACTQ
jgi:predicted DNA-binding transcriptional regulator AlpA